MWVGLEHCTKDCTLQTGNSKGGKHIAKLLLPLSTLSDISRDPGKIYRTASIEHTKCAHA